MKYIRTYGRLRCRNLNNDIMKGNTHLYDALPSSLREHNCITLEIGFGNGELLLHRSSKYTHQLHMGVEVYENGICKVLAHIQTHNSQNICVYNMDVRDFFLLLKNENTIKFSQIYVMFPDPWHKKSIKKRMKKRLVNETFIRNVYEALPTNGEFFFGTDHEDYYEQVKSYINDTPGLLILIETINKHINDDFVTSNYEKKATSDCYYLKAIRND